jgi:ribosomal protein S18 acetylase RimI-like enzyme
MEIQLESNIHKDLFNRIFHLYDENFSPHVRVPHSKIRKRVKNKTYKLISLKKNNEMIGFSLISLNPLLKTIFIDYLCVDKCYQRGGYGRQLLNEIHTLKFFPEYEYCVLECENYLVGYYQKNNFQKIPREYPLENSRPLFLLYRKRNSDCTNAEPLLYHKFITYGLLFNGEIKTMYQFLMMMYEKIFDIYTIHFSTKIMNYKSSHT